MSSFWLVVLIVFSAVVGLVVGIYVAASWYEEEGGWDE